MDGFGSITLLEDGLPVQNDPSLDYSLNGDQAFCLDETIDRIEVVRGGPSSFFYLERAFRWRSPLYIPAALATEAEGVLKYTAGDVRPQPSRRVVWRADRRLEAAVRRVLSLRRLHSRSPVITAMKATQFRVGLSPLPISSTARCRSTSSAWTTRCYSIWASQCARIQTVRSAAHRASHASYDIIAGPETTFIG